MLIFVRPYGIIRTDFLLERDGKMIKDKAFYREFFSLYVMLVLQNVIVLGVNLADNIMIGSYSETALSGVAAVNQIQFVFQQIIMGCGDAIVVLGSQYWGQKRCKEVNKISFSAMTLALLAAAILFTLALFIPEKVVGIFTPTEAIVASGVEYINIIKYTYIIFAITNVLLATLRCVETVKIAFLVSLATLFINCSINFVLIEGRFGFPELGVTGAAIGTLTARIIELVIVIIYVAFYDKKLKIKLTEYIKIDNKLYSDYIKIARSVVLVAAMFGVSTALQTVILGHMSDAAIAANSVSTSLFQTLKVASIGASAATSVIIGKAVGTGNIEKVKSYTKTLQIMFIIIGAVTSTLLFFLRIPILSLYDLSEETKYLANAFILVLCVTGFGTAYQMPALTGIVRGGGDPDFILKNDIISIWCIVLPVSFLAAFYWHWHPIAVVFCLNADQIFKCGAAAIKTNSYTWIKSLTRETKNG